MLCTPEGVFGTLSTCLVVLWSPISSSKFICYAQSPKESSASQVFSSSKHFELPLCIVVVVVDVVLLLLFSCRFFLDENSSFFSFFFSYSFFFFCFKFVFFCLLRFFTFLIWFRKVIAFPSLPLSLFLSRSLVCCRCDAVCLCCCCGYQKNYANDFIAAASTPSLSPPLSPSNRFIDEPQKWPSLCGFVYLSSSSSPPAVLIFPPALLALFMFARIIFCCPSLSLPLLAFRWPKKRSTAAKKLCARRSRSRRQKSS